MGQFPRPKGTVENFAELKVGDVLWHVYGSDPNCVIEKEPHTVVLAPTSYKNHPNWSKIHKGSEESIVFDTEVKSLYFLGSMFRDMHFASDGNLIPGRSHNDNYWCRTLEAATAAVEELRGRWNEPSARHPVHKQE